MLLIGLQTIILSLNSIKRNNTDYMTFINQNKVPKNISSKEADISATSISDITGIPRATCIRKLDKFVKMKVLEKDNKSKRYSLSLDQNTFNPMLETEWMKNKISILSNFSSIVIKSLMR